MADHLDIKVSVTPIEELAEEAGLETTSIIASDVLRVLGGSGTSEDLANYGGSAANQGYTAGTVNYFDTVVGDATVPTDLTATDSPDAIFIKNTGYKFSSVTVLGTATTDCVMVALEQVAWATGSQAGFSNEADSGEIHYYEIGWLKPGQAMVFPLGAVKNSITKMGAIAGDLTPMNKAGSSSLGSAAVVLKTFTSAGAEATDGNAVEYLVVT